MGRSILAEKVESFVSALCFLRDFMERRVLSVGIIFYALVYEFVQKVAPLCCFWLIEDIDFGVGIEDFSHAFSFLTNFMGIRRVVDAIASCFALTAHNQRMRRSKDVFSVVITLILYFRWICCFSHGFYERFLLFLSLFLLFAYNFCLHIGSFSFLNMEIKIFHQGRIRILCVGLFISSWASFSNFFVQLFDPDYWFYSCFACFFSAVLRDLNLLFVHYLESLLCTVVFLFPGEFNVYFGAQSPELKSRFNNFAAFHLFLCCNLLLSSSVFFLNINSHIFCLFGFCPCWIIS